MIKPIGSYPVNILSEECKKCFNRFGYDLQMHDNVFVFHMPYEGPDIDDEYEILRFIWSLTDNCCHGLSVNYACTPSGDIYYLGFCHDFFAKSRLTFDVFDEISYIGHISSVSYEDFKKHFSDSGIPSGILLNFFGVKEGVDVWF